MIVWLISRLLSYFTLIEFFDHLTEYSARGLVTVKSYLAPSEYVDTVDNAIPVFYLVIYEILLLALILGVFCFVGYIVSKIKKRGFNFKKILSNYFKFILWMGIIGVISRVLTFISISCFLDSRYIEYNALGISFTRDLIYLMIGVVFMLKNKMGKNAKPKNE